MKDVLRIGVTAGRPPHRAFGIASADRLQHIHVIGKTGVGKSTLLRLMLEDDVRNGRSSSLIDPHGDLAIAAASCARDIAPEKLIYLDATDASCPYGFNPLRRVARDRISLVASGLLETFKKRFFDAWGTRMEHIFRNAILALLEYGEASLPDLLTILTDRSFAKKVASRCENDIVRDFWLKEFPGYSPGFRKDAIAPIQTKLGGFLSNETVRKMLTEPKSLISFRRIMDEGSMLVVNLGKGVIGGDGASLFGALILSTIGHAALSRADTPLVERRPHFVYVDEFQNVMTHSVAEMLSELRKYGVGLVLAHQHLGQLDPLVCSSVLGNCGSQIVFRLGADDALRFSREFMPTLDPVDFLHLPNFAMYVRLMVGGEPSVAFSARVDVDGRMLISPRSLSRKIASHFISASSSRQAPGDQRT